MSNPLFEKELNILIYSVVWLVIAFIQFLLITLVYDLQPLVAFADTLIYNSLFAFLAVILWYPIMYNNPEGKINLSTFIFYIILGIIILLIWLFTGYYLLRIFFSENETYFHFLNDSFLGRVIAGLLYYFTILLIYHLIVYSRALQEKKLSETKLNLLVKESELNVLRSQMNPHFLFNSLNSISSLTLNNPDKAREMIIKLSDFLRYALKYGQKEKTNFEEELKNIQLYLDIEKVRFGDKLVFEYDIHDDCLSAKVPNMILQPLVENAIKHGVYESTKAVTIRLSCSESKDGCKIKISNNFDPDLRSRTGTGYGLKNVENRLLLIYNKEGLLTVKKEENLFEVTLNIPQN